MTKIRRQKLTPQSDQVPTIVPQRILSLYPSTGMVFSWLFPSVFELLCLYHNFNFFFGVSLREEKFSILGDGESLYVAFRRDIGSTSTANCGLPPYRKNVV